MELDSLEKTDVDQDTTSESDRGRSKKRKRMPRLRFSPPGSRSGSPRADMNSEPSSPESSPTPEPRHSTVRIAHHSPQQQPVRIIPPTNGRPTCPLPPSPPSVSRPSPHPPCPPSANRLNLSTSMVTDWRPYLETIIKKNEKILVVLEQQAAEIEALRSQVRRLEAAQEQGNSLSRESDSRPELPQGFIFPIKTNEELEQLNMELTNDVNVRKRLERHLYNLGGNTYKVSLRTAGATLLDPHLQGQYNVTGSSKVGAPKIAFTSLSSIHRVLYNAVHERHQTDQQTFNKYLSLWLSTWRDRAAGGKRNRVGEQQKRLAEGQDSIAVAEEREDSRI